MEAINESALYNNMKCFDSGRRKNKWVSSTIEIVRGTILKLRVGTGVLDSDVEEERKSAGMKERMTTYMFNMHMKSYAG